MDGPQEMERNLAAARHSWARQHAWLLLNFFPFPVGHPPHPPCTGLKTIQRQSLLLPSGPARRRGSQSGPSGGALFSQHKEGEKAERGRGTKEGRGENGESDCNDVCPRSDGMTQLREHRGREQQRFSDLKSIAKP